MAERDPEGELIDKVDAIGDFFRLVLNDALEDWPLAKDFGKFLTRLDPAGAIGHALLARAYRHLGDRQQALAELECCRNRITDGLERESLALLIAEEERWLGI